MKGTISFNDETGFWQVADEYGDVWDVMELDGGNAILVREDSQRYYGATWAADAGGSDHGEVYPRRDGDEIEGLESTYAFTDMAGWSECDG